MKHLTYLFLYLFLSFQVAAQVSINTDNSDPDASAMLDVKSTNKGMLVPRMTSSQRTMISNAAVGLLVFDTTTESFWFKDSSGWVELVAGGSTFSHDVANNIVRPDTSAVDVSTDDFVFGSAQLDDSGDANHDSRFFFDKSKGAFRAGMEEGNRWDDVNRGIGSVAMGTGNTAAGENSVAMGYESGAMSIGAVSLGYQNGALGDVTVAIGNRNVVDTDTAFAIGSYNYADKDYALAVGTENEAQEEASTAVGYANLATAIGASAFGEFNEANGESSLALGSGAIANGTASVAIGSSNAEGTGSLAVGIGNTASGDFSQAFGSEVTAPSYNETVFGYFNTSYTPTSSSNPSLTDRLFVIGNGMGPITSQRSDALILLKNGATRINGPLTLGISGNNLTSYTLPNIKGSTGQILQLNNSGVMAWVDNTDSDNQTIDEFKFSGGILELSLENDGESPRTVNLSAINSVQDIIENNAGTTSVDVSSNSLINFEAGGQEILTMQRGVFEFRNTNGSIYLGGDAGKSDNYSGLGNNIGIGSSALSNNRTGSENTAIGSNANVNSDNLSNATAIGANALVSQSNALVLGNNANVGIGTSTPDEKLHVVGNVKIEDGNAQAGYILTSDANGVGTWQQNTGANGIQNVIQDGDADTKIQVEESADEDVIRFDLAGTELMRLDSGRIEILNNNKNIFIGNDAGFDFNANHDAFNVIIGEEAGSGLTSGAYNTGVGSFALRNNTEGLRNTAFGMSTALENTTGDYNTAIGYFALNNNKTGNYNVAIGSQALYTNLSTINNIQDNIAIGWRAGFNVTGNGNILIGRSAGSDQNGNNRLIIENSGSTTPLIYGEFDNDLVRINGDLEVTGSFPGSDNQKIDVLNLNGNTLQVSLENDGENTKTVDLSNLAVPVGSMMMWPTATPPSGWLICNGQSITAYPQLVAVLGSNNAPDLEDKFPYGAGPLRGLGQAGGVESVTLSEANIPKHSHDSGTLRTTYFYKSNNSSAGSSSNKDGSDVQFYNGNAITGDTGEWGGAANGLTQSFSIIPFYRTVHFIIKAE